MRPGPAAAMPTVVAVSVRDRGPGRSRAARAAGAAVGPPTADTLQRGGLSCRNS